MCRLLNSTPPLPLSTNKYCACWQKQTVCQLCADAANTQLSQNSEPSVQSLTAHARQDFFMLSKITVDHIESKQRGLPAHWRSPQGRRTQTSSPPQSKGVWSKSQSSSSTLCAQKHKMRRVMMCLFTYSSFSVCWNHGIKWAHARPLKRKHLNNSVHKKSSCWN